VSDIFREVEEEVRRERFAKLWKSYGDYLIAAIAILVIGVAGYKLWQYYDQKQRVKASNEYEAAEQLVAAQSYDKAAAAFGKLSQSAPSGYTTLARMQEADALLAAGKNAQALSIYKKIATGGGDAMLTSAARLRAGWMMVENTPKKDLATFLAPVTNPASAWHSAAREILAFADYKAGNMKSALTQYQNLSKDTAAPGSLRQRADAMAAFITAGGDQNYGTVPPPAKPPVPQNADVTVQPGAQSNANPANANPDTPKAGTSESPKAQ
jgi:hypothetical protein